MFSTLSNNAKCEENVSQTPIDGMDSKEAVFIIKKTWRELMKNEHEVGKKIYAYVLTKEISMSVLFINSQVEQQSILFMKMLDTVIGFLDDENTMDNKLVTLGAIHADKYGVKNEHYKPFRTAFLNAIKTFIPWNSRRETAWLWFWDRIIRCMSTVQKKEPTVSLDVSPKTALEYFFAIHESLNNVMESPVTFGVALYRALLNEQCEIANLFPKTEFESHSAHLVSMLGHTVRLLDDQVTFQNKIQSIAHQYRDYGIKIPQLQLFGNIFIKTLKAINNDQWSPMHNESWEWFWDIVIKLFRLELEKNKINAHDRQIDDNGNVDSNGDIHNNLIQ